MHISVVHMRVHFRAFFVFRIRVRHWCIRWWIHGIHGNAFAVGDGSDAVATVTDLFMKVTLGQALQVCSGRPCGILSPASACACARYGAKSAGFSGLINSRSMSERSFQSRRARSEQDDRTARDAGLESARHADGSGVASRALSTKPLFAIHGRVGFGMPDRQAVHFTSCARDRDGRAHPCAPVICYDSAALFVRGYIMPQGFIRQVPASMPSTMATICRQCPWGARCPTALATAVPSTLGTDVGGSPRYTPSWSKAPSTPYR